MNPEHLPKLLFLLMLIPLLGSVVLTLLPAGQARLAKMGAIIFSSATFLASLVLACQFDWNNPAVQFQGAVKWMPGLALVFAFGVDALSLWLVLLTTLLSLVAVVAALTSTTQRVREFFAWVLLLEAVMVGAFIATDLIFFYICFEFTLVPMYFLIGIHGGSDRLRAARTFFLYTFTGSLLTFAGILYVAWWNHVQTGGWSFAFTDLYAAALTMSDTQQLWVMLAMLAGFAVKVPLFPLHSWQPLAYTQAPIAGTVLLSGVVLKLATYALIRLALPLAPQAALTLAPWIGVLAVVGIIYAALICWVQNDIKKLLAYSSMSHMGFCVLGIFAINLTGLTGAMIYMINHGLTIAALFFCAGMVMERFQTRRISDLSGLARIMPVWAFFMVFFVFASIGLPGLNGFVGEFLTLLGTAAQRELLGPWFAALAGTGIILSAIYMLTLAGKVVFGPLKHPAASAHATQPVRDLTAREIAVLVPLAIGCLWLGLYPQPVLRTLQPSLEPIVATVQSQAASQVARQGDASTPAVVQGVTGDAGVDGPSVNEMLEMTLAARLTSPSGQADPESTR